VALTRISPLLTWLKTAPKSSRKKRRGKGSPNKKKKKTKKRRESERNHARSRRRSLPRPGARTMRGGGWKSSIGSRMKYTQRRRGRRQRLTTRRKRLSGLRGYQIREQRARGGRRAEASIILEEYSH